MTDEVTNSGNLPPHAIILAAGKGKRMKGREDLPKVLYEVAGEPMLQWVVRACREAGVERCVLVVGYKSELVRQALAAESDCEFVEQTEQLGTGHATQMAAPLFENGPARDVFVLAGDGPLIQAKTLARLLEIHRRTRAAATLATAVIDDPTGYGRIVRDADRSFRSIVEHKDANEQELAIKEVNPSYYCFQSDLLFETLKEVKNDNNQGEYYVTPVPTLLKEKGHTVSVVEAVPAADVLSINTPEQHAEVDAILRARLTKVVG